MPQAPRNPLSQNAGSEYRSEEQQENDAQNRRKALINTIDHAHAHRLPAVAFVDLVDVLGLEEELDELAGGDQQRQQRLVDVRAQLQLKTAGGRLE